MRREHAGAAAAQGDAGELVAGWTELGEMLTLRALVMDARGAPTGAQMSWVGPN